jgi:hypothetical protein
LIRTYAEALLAAHTIMSTASTIVLRIFIGVVPVRVIVWVSPG